MNNVLPDTTVQLASHFVELSEDASDMGSSNTAFAGLVTDVLTSFDIFLGQLWQNNMVNRIRNALFFGLAAHQVAAQCSQQAANVDLNWHAPNQTNINNLSVVVNGTGSNGVYNTSTTPATSAYSTYNWCNMPHVRRQEYPVAAQGYELVYVELVRFVRESARLCKVLSKHPQSS